ncbi:hypothetical protein IWW50_005466, partial [Coemansia erecta]
MLRVPDSEHQSEKHQSSGQRAGARAAARIDFRALQQWAATGEIKKAHSGNRRRRYRLGRWQSRSTSSWNPPNAGLSMSVPQMASQSRQSLVSIDISHKPSESRRASMGSMHAGPSPPADSVISDDYDELDGAGPLAELLLRENDEIWSNDAYRFTFYSPATGTVRATDVQTLCTGSADGLAELVQQALGRDEVDAVPSTDAPQLSVTSVDAAPAAADPAPASALQAPDNEFLHPNYARGQGARLRGAARPGAAQQGAGMARDLAATDARLFWLDVMDPGDDEVQALAQIFDLHPLTVDELLLMRDQAQDSFKSFRHYDIVCYRTSS